MKERIGKSVRTCMSAWVHKCARGQPAKEVVLCVFSAALLVLSFPDFNLEILAWIGFVPLFFALRNKSAFKSFFLAYFAGAVFWSGTIYWLIHVTPAGLIILVLYLSFYFGLFGSILSFFTRYALRVTRHDFLLTLLFIPSLWVVLEYLRGFLFTGFPWIPLGYSQYLSLPVIQIADITGVWGVSFLVMMVNTAVYSVIGCRCTVNGVIRKIAVPLLCLIFVLLYGYTRLSDFSGSARDTRHAMRNTALRISVIQGNIPQEMKWDRSAGEFIIEKYMGFTSASLARYPDLVIWPEAAFPFVLAGENDYSPLPSLLKKFDVPFLVGAVTSERLQYHNSVLLIAERGMVVDSYRKIHLVPFGEYIPLRGVFGFLETIVPIGDFFPGAEHTVFTLPRAADIHFGVLICFEDVFPGLSRRLAREGADFLVNMTNDAWFGKTSSPYQHLSASVFRAVENRLPVVRCANTGVSGFVSPAGKIISLVRDKQGEHIFIGGIGTETILLKERPLSFYSRCGDVFVAVCGIIFVCGISIAFMRSRSGAHERRSTRAQTA